MARHKMVDGVKVMFTEAEEKARDAEEAEASVRRPKEQALRLIEKLESSITPRRIRDALANDAGKKWVADVEALIATERGKL
jgi:predicted RNA binding protein with dsRBD fold (UPF0201 family)